MIKQNNQQNVATRATQNFALLLNSKDPTFS